MLAWTFAITSWVIFYFGVLIPMIVFGWVLIPIMALLGRYEFRASKYFYINNGEVPKKILAWHDKWMWPWGNEEDGIAAGRQYQDAGATWKQIIYWSALRNPVNNLRFVPLLSVKIDPEKIGYVGRVKGFDAVESPRDNERRYILDYFDKPCPQWFLCWQGAYSNFYWQFTVNRKLYRFWIGWKIFPTDIYGVTTYRKPGAGFAAQLKVVDKPILNL